MGGGKWIKGVGYVVQRQIKTRAGDQLEGGQLIGGRSAGAGEERHNVLDPGDPEKRGFDFARSWEELQGRGSDDPQRAFAADEELLQIVAGVVLTQPAQPVPNPAVGQHDFEPQSQIAGVAVAPYR